LVGPSPRAAIGPVNSNAATAIASERILLIMLLPLWVCPTRDWYGSRQQ
jgi:hypothetical protein